MKIVVSEFDIDEALVVNSEKQSTQICKSCEEKLENAKGSSLALCDKMLTYLFNWVQTCFQTFNRLLLLDSLTNHLQLSDMRAPEGAPVTGWWRLQQKFPSLRKISSPSLGSVAVIATLALTVFTIYAVGVQPKINNEYYRQSQTEKRAQIKATKEELAQGLPVWKDPFDRK